MIALAIRGMSVNRLLVEGAYDEGNMWTTVLVEVAAGSLEREPDALTGLQNVVAKDMWMCE